VFEQNGNQLETRYTSGIERVVRNQTLLLKLLIPLSCISLQLQLGIMTLTSIYTITARQGLIFRLCIATGVNKLPRRGGFRLLLHIPFSFGLFRPTRAVGNRVAGSVVREHIP